MQLTTEVQRHLVHAFQMGSECICWMAQWIFFEGQYCMANVRSIHSISYIL